MAQCNKHDKGKCQWLCLEPNRFGDRGPHCLICLTDSHKSCRPEFHVKTKEIAKILKLITADFDDSNFYVSVLDIIESEFKDLKERVTKKADSSKQILDEFKTRFESDPVEALDAFNPTIQAIFNHDQKKIELHHILTNHQELKDDCVKQVKAKLKSFSDAIETEISNKEWEIKETPEPSSIPECESSSLTDLLKQKDFITSLNGNVFDISRNINEDKSAYLIYDKKLEEGMSLKVTLKSVNTNDRHFVLGIVDSSRYDSIKQKNYEDADGGLAAWFNGYSCSSNISGKYLATSPSDANGFKAGDVIYLAYKSGSIAIFNDDKTIDLHSVDLTKALPIYVFLRFFRKETAVMLEPRFK